MGAWACRCNSNWKFARSSVEWLLLKLIEHPSFISIYSISVNNRPHDTFRLQARFSTTDRPFGNDHNQRKLGQFQQLLREILVDWIHVDVAVDRLRFVRQVSYLEERAEVTLETIAVGRPLLQQHGCTSSTVLTRKSSRWSYKQRFNLIGVLNDERKNQKWSDEPFLLLRRLDIKQRWDHREV